MSENTIRLSDHFTAARLLRFTFPSIVMIVFTSIYSVVDGFFVSNFTGKTAFAAVNFIMPLLMLLGGAGFLFGTGGAALIAKTFGEKNPKKANEIFSLVVYAAAFCGAVIAAASFFALPKIVSLLGAEGALFENSVRYGRIVCATLPLYIIQYEFQCLFAAAGKTKLGLYVTVASGCTNMALDALFVAAFGWGLKGAAAATAFAQGVGGIIPLVYFARKNTSSLKLGRCRIDLSALAKTIANGSSELVNSVSASVVGMLYNLQLLKYAGENGVASYGVLMYVGFIFNAVFIGYSVGAAPIAGFHYGAKNFAELRSLRRKSLAVVALCALCMFAAGMFFALPLSRVFVGYDKTLLEQTSRAFKIFSFSFLLSGFSIFGSSFFTALNDGLTSALISFLRTFVFQCAAVLMLPIFFGTDGIWISCAAAEFFSAAATAIFFAAKRRRYGY
ncbi:MAG: MATE family efflux transporter [Bacteroides sp.]|nr:MATE family efflux transporter [Prevotella sp.]MCM1407805.1 MATE family efflux transporter [Treponema brennaborense]MCM1468847.1 MATE family efflux transporter [Bacteroides sp.]